MEDGFGVLEFISEEGGGSLEKERTGGGGSTILELMGRDVRRRRGGGKGSGLGYQKSEEMEPGRSGSVGKKGRDKWGRGLEQGRDKSVKITMARGAREAIRKGGQGDRGEEQIIYRKKGPLQVEIG